MERTRVALDCLGCKLNQAEIELLARQFLEAGYSLVSTADEADVYVLNTCTVTHIADRKSRHLLRMARRRNPDIRLVATGCYAERAPGELAKIGGVNLIVGNEQKEFLPQLLESHGYLDSPTGEIIHRHGNGRHTRTMIKVQDGCSRFCSYCIVPVVRGREKSVPVAQVIDTVKLSVAGGCQEVVLTGTEVGSYDADGIDLKALLEHILAETDIVRLRLSSLQPQEISPAFIELWRNTRLCPHFHLSLQSGSDGVLKRMERGYSAADYQRAVSLIREAVPGAAISTDIIVGFPGETEAQFRESYDFCRGMGFARIHVFPYSPRPGTVAARMPQPVADKVKKQRSQVMLSLADESARYFQQRFLGRTLPVLWEKQSREGVWSGFTGNYIKVYAENSEDLTNRLLPAKLLEVRRDGVRGEACL